MREIKADKISETIARLCKSANCFLPEDVWRALKAASLKETLENAQWIMSQILENARVAGQKEMAICQDTGVAEIFMEIGQETRVVGAQLKDAVNAGVARGYTDGYLRKSILGDPLKRENTGDNTPAFLYSEIVAGDKIKITVLPKGAGSDNSSVLKMMSPSAGVNAIKDFVVESVKSKGINSCPPLIIGIGLGGTFSTVAMLSKKALLREIGSEARDNSYKAIEKEILDAVNKTGIGPMGLGGNTTALAVHIESAPCHIASLPLAVNFWCHAARKITETI